MWPGATGEGRKFQAATDLTNIQQNISHGLHALHAFSYVINQSANNSTF